MSKIFGHNLPVSATLLPELEAGGDMQPGDVTMRQTLEAIAPREGKRDAWFVAVGQRVGMPARRVRSLFYNRHCRLWGDELARITSAVNKANHKKNENLLHALNAHADRCVWRKHIEEIKGEITRDVLQDIRTLLLELHHSGGGMAIRRPGQNMPDA